LFYDQKHEQLKKLYKQYHGISLQAEINTQANQFILKNKYVYKVGHFNIEKHRLKEDKGYKKKL